MQSDRVPLYVRLPRAQADALDQLVDSTGRRKQQLVSELLADRLQLGRVNLGESAAMPLEVLTTEQLAELLSLDESTVLELAERGELPARKLAGEWRFARAAVMRWLEGDTRAPAG